MQEMLTKLLRHKLTENLIALYGAHFARYLLPLITVPYVARILGVSTWGTVAFVQAYGVYVSLLLEFGFGLSATRDVARHRDSTDYLANILAGVMGAKVLLALLAVGVTVMIQPWVPLLRDNPRLLWVGVFGAVLQGFNLLWYFQGLERMRLVATLDVLTKIIGTAGIFWLLRSPEDAWKMLAAYAVANLMSTSLALIIAYREVPFRFPTKLQILTTLRTSWTLFLVRAGASFFSAGNTIILGLSAPPVLIGYFVGAEKIATSVRMLLTPAVDALYPRLSYLVSKNRQKASSFIQVVLVAMGFFGAILGISLFLFAPFLVYILLGEEFGPAVPVVRVLSVLPLVIAINHVLGVQWMLPLGMDQFFSASVLGAGLLDLVLALILAPRFGHVGVAWSIVISQTSIMVSLWVLININGESFIDKSS